MKKKLYSISASLLLILLLAGCGTGDSETASNAEAEPAENEEAEEGEETAAEEEAKTADELGDFEVELAGEVIEEDDKFVIEGQSNLIPGSRLVGEVIVQEDEVFSDTTELIQDDGSFYMELAHHQYGEADIVVRFDFDNVQDDPVIRHYGERGQNLEGPFVYKHEVLNDIYKKAEVSVHYDSEEKNDLVFTAPDWYELPDDYGDPRVWIEVDEITEDGEFYYLHGRSNLLEGAEIKGSFGGNRDTVQIKPDGSFDLKIEYEYIEDENFIIEFDPRYQWNEVEEAYGSKGQKLVGNLVVANEYSDNQTIEKEIPWDENGSAKDNEAEDENGENDKDDEDKKDDESEKE